MKIFRTWRSIAQLCDVYLSDRLKLSQFSISQLCDKGNKVTFNST